MDTANLSKICTELELPEVEVPQRFHFQDGALKRTIDRLISCFESQIAADCGFADQSHLLRSFKRHTGLTPLQFRR